MSVRFKCPNCQTVRTLHTRMMGREIRCPECEAPILIPSQAELDIAKADREAERRFMRAAQQIAATGAYNAPVSSFQSATAAPSQQLDLKPKRAQDEDELDDEPQMKRRTLPHDHIDMTPMVDITFLLLIFFMSTANFTLQKSMQVPVQKEQKASTRAVQVATDPTLDSVTVQVDEHNAYLILMPDGTDREAASKPDLMLALEEARNSSASGEPPDKLIIEAHRDCVHRAVVTALDAGTDLKFERFQVTVVDDF